MQGKVAITGIVIILAALYSCRTSAEEFFYIDLDEELPINPAPSIRYFEDAQGMLTLRDARAEQFLALPENQVDFGYSGSKFWLRFGVQNDSDQARDLVLRTSARFMRPLEIYQGNQQGSFTRILYNDENSVFGQRPGGIRHLGVEFTLAADSATEFYIRVGAGGRVALAMEITTNDRLLVEQSSATLKVLLLLAVIGTLIMSNLFYFAALRAWSFLLYVIQEIFFVLYAAHMEGFTFQYLWPNAPALNANATPVLGSLCNVFAIWFSISFLRSRHYTPSYYWLLMALLLFACGQTLFSVFAVSRISNQIALLLPLMVTLAFFPHAIYVISRGHMAARYYLAGWIFLYIFVSYFVAVMMDMLPVLMPPLDAVKVGTIAEAIILSMGLADQYRRLNEENIKTQAQLVEQLNARLVEARERVKLEKEKEVALKQVLEKSRVLASTSHDIVQPIRSLRLALDSATVNIRNPEVLASVTGTLDDMESVIGQALDDASGALKHATNDVRTNIEQLLNDVAMRFQTEVLEKDLFIRVHAPPLSIAVSSLGLKRCINNLVSNAIHNTVRGGILMAARRRNSGLLVQVYDTGRGISEDDQETLLEFHAKGVDSTGHGLGLAIIRGICDESQWDFSLRSIPKKGSCFSIYIPGVLA